MKRRFFFFFSTLWALASALSVQAFESSVKIVADDQNGFRFYCNGRPFISDVQMENVHGCDTVAVPFADGGTATLLSVHHGWVNTGQSHTPYITHYLHVPDNSLYRLVDTGFIFNPRLKNYFDETVGRTGTWRTNITLEKFGAAYLERYGNTFCLGYQMRYPFIGRFGWCQGDTIMSGDVSFAEEALPFARAALLAYDAALERNIRFTDGAFLSNVNMTALNRDPNGWLYYAFAFPGVSGPYEDKRFYIVRVYFNGQTSVQELTQEPQGPDVL